MTYHSFRYVTITDHKSTQVHTTLIFGKQLSNHIQLSWICCSEHTQLLHDCLEYFILISQTKNSAVIYLNFLH